MARLRSGRLCLLSFLVILITALLFVFSGKVLSLQRYTLLPENQGSPLSSGTEKGHQRTNTKRANGKIMDNSVGVKPEPMAPVILEKRGKSISTEQFKTFSPTTPAARLRGERVSSSLKKGATEEQPDQTSKTTPEAPVMIEHEKDQVVLPKISPIPGVTLVETMIKLMEHELKGRFLGWRPNDLIIGRFTDNVNNYQLGVLEAMRFTTLRLKDSLTRMGEADSYDRDLEDALNLFMNDATSFWFPSAESSYGAAVEHLKRFLHKLKTGKRRLYRRTDNLLALLVSYGDLLGNVNRTLIMDRHGDGRPVSWFETDDYFYYAKGVAHVMYEILKVVRVGFKDQLLTIDAIEIMDNILHELHRAEKIDPWIILDGDLGGLFANHRANLNAPLSEVTHLILVMSRF